MRKSLIIIIATFCVSFVSMIALSVFSVNRLTVYINYANITDTSNFVIDCIYEVEIHLRDIDRAEKGFIITEDTAYLRHLKTAKDSLYSDFELIQKLTKGSPSLQKKLLILRDSIGRRIEAANRNIENAKIAKDNYSYELYTDSRSLMRSCSRQLRLLYLNEKKLFNERINFEHIYETLTTRTIKYLLIIFCIITLILFFLMVKELIGRTRYQKELQSKVIDLKRSHIELEEIAYAASHDLQEPLRKIQVFSNMLLYFKNNTFDTESLEILKRINSSANRIQTLINDLHNLTSLTRIDDNKTLVDLNRILQFVLIDLDEKVKEKNAVVKIDRLPEISGYEHQLKLMFSALLDNSLKFTRENVDPEIVINYSLIDGKELSDINSNLVKKQFHLITITDNGTGFENNYLGKIFRLFQQLNNQQSVNEGKGIGLAICQRIITNHDGYIMADGKKDAGAIFKLFFPV